MKKAKLAYRLAYALTLSGPLALLAAFCPFRAPAAGLYAVAGWLFFATAFLPGVTVTFRTYFAAALDPAARRLVEFFLIAAYWLVFVPAGFLYRAFVRARPSSTTTCWSRHT